LSSFASRTWLKNSTARYYRTVTEGTGVAHILEHSVLCGSRKYPIKEPSS
jgi:hypothetical protein